MNPTQKSFPVSWDQFHRDSRALAWRLTGEGPFAAVVAITRGGLVPAAIVARELNIRTVECVAVKSYDHQNQGSIRVLKPISQSVLDLLGKEKVLIVDDLVDTGATARVVRDMLPEAPISPPSTPSPRGARWSTPSSPKSARTPGSISRGISTCPTPRRFPARRTDVQGVPAA